MSFADVPFNAKALMTLCGQQLMTCLPGAELLLRIAWYLI